MERTSISNIAWPNETDEEAIELACHLGFTGIELAPAKIFGPLATANLNEAKEYRKRLKNRGLEIPALQSILFGLLGISLFGDSDELHRLRGELGHVARVAHTLGANACVFGAPLLRDPKRMEPDAAFEHAVRFFRSVAPVFAELGTAIAFEANVPAYGCRFITTTSEAISFVEAVGLPGFRLQIDTGTVFMAEEDPGVVRLAAPLAIHFHVSEPLLGPPTGISERHVPIAAALRASSYNRWLSVEMKATPQWRENLNAAAGLMRTVYLRT